MGRHTMGSALDLWSTGEGALDVLGVINFYSSSGVLLILRKSYL